MEAATKINTQFERRKKELPAVGIQAVFNLTDNRQCTVQTHFAQDDDPAEMSRALDLVFGLLDKQQARYEILSFEDKIDALERSTANFNGGVAVAENNYQKAVAATGDKVAVFDQQYKDIHTAAYNDHIDKGKSGTFVPRGNVEINLNRIVAARDEAKNEISKHEAERKVAMDNVQIALKRNADEIEKFRYEIEKRKRVLGK